MSNYTRINLEHESPDIREETALNIALDNDKNAVDALITQLNKEQEISVKEMLIYALGKIGDKKAIDSLQNCLKDKNTRIRWTTVVALGRIASPESINSLLAHLSKEKEWVIKESIIKSLEQLAYLNPEVIIKTLVPYIKDKHSLVSMSAINAIEKTIKELENLSVTQNQFSINGAVTQKVQEVQEIVSNLVSNFVRIWYTPVIETRGIETQGSYGKENQAQKKLTPSKASDLTIEGQLYQLKVSYTGKNDKGNNEIKFELKPLNESGIIPKGYKLRLLTDKLEDFPNNEDKADCDRPSLEIKVELEPEDKGIAWETEPVYEGFMTHEIFSVGEILPTNVKENKNNDVLIPLRKWLQKGAEVLKEIAETGWLTLEEMTQSSTLAPSALRSLEFPSLSVDSADDSAILRGKFIDLGAYLGDCKVSLWVTLRPVTEEKISIFVQVRPEGDKTFLPPNLKLILLDESGKNRIEVISRSRDNWIQLPEFTVSLEDQFAIQLILGEKSIIQNFIASC